MALYKCNTIGALKWIYGKCWEGKIKDASPSKPMSSCPCFLVCKIQPVKQIHFTPGRHNSVHPELTVVFLEHSSSLNGKTLASDLSKRFPPHVNIHPFTKPFIYWRQRMPQYKIELLSHTHIRTQPLGAIQGSVSSSRSLRHADWRSWS